MTSRPKDRTPGLPGSDKNLGKYIFKILGKHIFKNLGKYNCQFGLWLIPSHSAQAPPQHDLMVSGRNLTLPSTRVTNGLNGLFLPNQAKQQRIVLHLEPNLGNWPICWNYNTHLSELCHFGTPPKFLNPIQILEFHPNFETAIKLWNSSKILKPLQHFGCWSLHQSVGVW